MSWSATAWAKKYRRCPNGEDITRSEKFLMLIMADYYNDHSKVTSMNMSTLADDALMDERTARRLVRSLERKGVVLSAVGGRGRYSEYRFPEIESRQIQGGQIAPDKGGITPPINRQKSNNSRGAQRPLQGGQIAHSRGANRDPYKENSIRERIREPAQTRGPLEKEVKESEPNPDIKQELIKRAAALFEDERNRQKMAIFVLNMTDGRAADQMSRAVPVIERCIAALRLALMKGTKIDDPLGWMTRVYNSERTKFIQEVEHPRNKAPVPLENIGAIFDRIGKGRA